MVATRTGRHTTLAAVVVAFAVMCAAVSAALHTAAADADKTCTSHSDGGDTVAVDFDVVAHSGTAWSATVRAANHARSRSQPRAWAAASHARRLEALREAVKPSAARIARVLDFIGRDILAFVIPTKAIRHLIDHQSSLTQFRAGTFRSLFSGRVP